MNASSVPPSISNVTTVRCPDDSVNLPEASIDLAFICDTYHHFEFPKSTMASLHRALRSGGEVVIVDFKFDYEGMPEKRRAWVHDHVRADKATTVREMESFGFRRLPDPADTSFLTENYIIRFRKID